MVVFLVAAAGRGPAAAAAVLAWRLCQIWPRSKFGLAVTFGQEIGIGHFNRQELRLYNNYNNSTSKRTSLWNYMFQLIWNIHAVPTFERHGAVRKPEYLSTRLLVFCHEEFGGTAAAEALIVLFSYYATTRVPQH